MVRPARCKRLMPHLYWSYSSLTLPSGCVMHRIHVSVAADGLCSDHMQKEVLWATSTSGDLRSLHSICTSGSCELYLRSGAPNNSDRHE